jgi:hypothetical protein
MKYAELDNLEIVEIHEELPRAWRNISGLCNYPDDELADLGWSGNGGCAFYPVVEGSQPSHDPTTQKLTSSYEVDAANFVVNKVWSAVSYTQDEIDQRWVKVRADRNLKLTRSDYTQMSDAPLTTQEKSDWATYRQALRDLPQNTANPFDVSFPTRP